MVFSMNAFKNKNVGKIKKNVINVKNRALNKKSFLYIYAVKYRCDLSIGTKILTVY